MTSGHGYNEPPKLRFPWLELAMWNAFMIYCLKWNRSAEPLVLFMFTLQLLMENARRRHDIEMVRYDRYVDKMLRVKKVEEHEHAGD
jgi:hypothetical protein